MTKQDRINGMSETIKILQAEKKAVDFVLVDRELTIDEQQRVQRSQDMVIRDMEEELNDLRKQFYVGADKDTYEMRIQNLEKKNEWLSNANETLQAFIKDLKEKNKSLSSLSGQVTVPVEVVGRAEVRGMVKTIVRDELADMVDRLLEK